MSLCPYVRPSVHPSITVMALAGFEGFGRIPQFFEKDSRIPQYFGLYIREYRGIYGTKLGFVTFASSICPDKIFFVQDNIEIVQDKKFVQS